MCRFKFAVLKDGDLLHFRYRRVLTKPKINNNYSHSESCGCCFATLCDRSQASVLGARGARQIRRSERWRFVALSLPAELHKAIKQISGHSAMLWPLFVLLYFSCHPSASTLTKNALSLALHHVLASLVKGRWIDGKAQTVALLRFTCGMSDFFIHQTFLPSRRRDCHTNPCPTKREDDSSYIK